MMTAMQRWLHRLSIAVLALILAFWAAGLPGRGEARCSAVLGQREVAVVLGAMRIECVGILDRGARHLPLFGRWGWGFAEKLGPELQRSERSGLGVWLHRSRWAGTGGGEVRVRILAVPYPLILLPASVLPGIRLVKWIGRRFGRSICRELRPARILLHLFTVVCLLLLFLAVEWLFDAGEASWRHPSGYYFQMQSVRKGVHWRLGWPLHHRDPWVDAISANSPPIVVLWNWSGLGVSSEKGRELQSWPDGSPIPGNYLILDLPKWYCIAAAMPLPLLRGLLARRRWRLKRRRQLGLCLQCGYDLRESPQRCPECGMPVGGLQAGDAADPGTA